MKKNPMYRDEKNVMFATTHKYGHTGHSNRIGGSPSRFLQSPGGRVLIAILVGAILGATLGAIAGSFRLAVGFGIGFGLISGLIFGNELRRNHDETGK